MISVSNISPFFKVITLQVHSPRGTSTPGNYHRVANAKYLYKYLNIMVTLRLELKDS